MSINRNEVRVGNAVHTKNGDCVLWVAEIMASGITYDCKHQVAEHEEWANINPIQLTPEILDKASFRQDAHTYPDIYFYKDEMWGIRLNEDAYELCVVSQVKFLVKYDPIITSLHQLQNLFFALTGKELEVNL